MSLIICQLQKMVSIPKLVTPRRLSLVLLIVYLVYMVAMYLKDLKEEEKEQAKVETVVSSSIAVNTTDGGKDTSVVMLLNEEGVSKVDVKEDKGKEDKGGDKGGEGESKGRGEGKEELRVGGELSASVDPPRNYSWLRNMTEVRLWIGKM